LFELEHGTDHQRNIYNARMLATVRANGRVAHGVLFGLSDLFTPIVRAGKYVAALVVGPFLIEPPTSASVLESWRALTGRQGRPADAEFSAFMAAIRELLVLNGEQFEKLTKFMGCLARLMAGEGDAGALTNEANALLIELEPARLIERT